MEVDSGEEVAFGELEVFAGVSDCEGGVQLDRKGPVGWGLHGVAAGWWCSGSSNQRPTSRSLLNQPHDSEFYQLFWRGFWAENSSLKNR